MLIARLWFARLVAFYALLLFAFLAYLYVVEPLAHIESFGIRASGSPESINFLRAGPGALFAGMALLAALGLVWPPRLVTCLWGLVLFTGCVVAVRLYGMAVDGASAVQWTELRDEGLSWLVFVAALAVHPRRRLQRAGSAKDTLPPASR